jgi:hypothetical protein
MNKLTRILTGLAATIAIIVAVFWYTSGSSRGASQYKMMNVGGKMNQCECTHRLEK